MHDNESPPASLYPDQNLNDKTSQPKRLKFFIPLIITFLALSITTFIWLRSIHLLNNLGGFSESSSDAKIPNDSFESFFDTKIPLYTKSEDVPSEVLASSILLHTKEYELFLKQSLTEKKTLLLPNVYAYSISNDKTRIAFIDSPPDSFEEIETGEFFILDLNTMETRTYTTNSLTQRSILWSPGDEYILVNSGTGPIGSTVTYSVEDGNAHCTFSNFPVWMNESEFFVTYFDWSREMRPWGGGEATGVMYGNIHTCSFEVFLEATDTNDYAAVDSYESFLVVRETFVQNVSDWWDDGETENPPYESFYSLYDPVTKEKSPNSWYYDMALGEKERARVGMEKVLSEHLDFESLAVEEHPTYSDWFLVNVYLSGSIYNREVYLVGLGDGFKLIFIEEGHARWL